MNTKQRIVWLRETLKCARKHYHNFDNHRAVLRRDGTIFEAITDAEYDSYEEELRGLSPNDSLFDAVGAPPEPGMVRHALPMPMLSLGKIKPDGSAARWIRETRGPWNVSHKEDGVSIEIAHTPNGVNMYTRGDGYEGLEITALADAVAGMGHLQRGQIIRAEMIIPDADFPPHADEYSNPRALVAGVANRAGQSGTVHSAASVARLIVHGHLRPALTIAETERALTAAGWDVVPNTMVRDFGPDPEGWLIEHLKVCREASPTAIDGLVLESIDGIQIAFKGIDREAVVTVDHIQWRASRFGVWKPRVWLTAPEPLDGVSVVKATAHNARFIVDHGIGPGARIRIVRAGSVIPKIVGVVEPVEPQYPDGGWAWDRTNVNLRVVAAGGDNSAEIAQRRLTHFLHWMGVEGIKDGSAAKLVAAGIDNPLRLCAASFNTLKAAGLGPVASNNLVSDLKRALANTCHLYMMVACGVFPHGWGETRLRIVLTAYDYDELLNLANGSEAEFWAAFERVPNIGSVLLTQLQRAVPRYATWIDRLGWACDTSLPHTEPAVEGPLNGCNVVFTKVRSKEMEARIEALGGSVSDKVDGATRWVVTLPGASSSKTKAGVKRGIKPISLDELRAELDLHDATNF